MLKKRAKIITILNSNPLSGTLDNSYGSSSSSISSAGNYQSFISNEASKENLNQKNYSLHNPFITQGFRLWANRIELEKKTIHDISPLGNTVQSLLKEAGLDSRYRAQVYTPVQFYQFVHKKIDIFKRSGTLISLLPYRKMNQLVRKELLAQLLNQKSFQALYELEASSSVTEEEELADTIKNKVLNLSLQRYRSTYLYLVDNFLKRLSDFAVIIPLTFLQTELFLKNLHRFFQLVIINKQGMNVDKIPLVMACTVDFAKETFVSDLNKPLGTYQYFAKVYQEVFSFDYKKENSSDSEKKINLRGFFFFVRFFFAKLEKGYNKINRE